MDENYTRIDATKMMAEFNRILLKNGFLNEKAKKCAKIFTGNSIDGVYSHGVNRFSEFVNRVKEGYVIPEAMPVLVHKMGAVEQWDGNSGPGPLNASFATDKAIDIAKNDGIGLVALANTNHWMRGGAYGWQAVKKGVCFIGWTNTEQNMPAWGAKDVHLGNNPLVIAVPYKEEAVVLDFAMTQFSYGKMSSYAMNKEKLPFPGGFDESDNLTSDPDEILKTKRALPIGYWKGSGLSLLLDILATILTGGLSTHEISKLDVEHRTSQVFIAINLEGLNNYSAINKCINNIINDLNSSKQDDSYETVHYPGARSIKTRKENLKNGIPVNKKVWENILRL